MSKYACGIDACSPSSIYLKLTTLLSTTISLSPYLILFTGIVLFSSRYLFPYLSSFRPPPPPSLGGGLGGGGGGGGGIDAVEYRLPADAPPSLQQAHAEHEARHPGLRRRVAGWTFSVTMGLAGVLGVLILVGVRDVDSMSARGARAAGVPGEMDDSTGDGTGILVNGKEKREALLRSVVLPTLLFLLVGMIPFLEILSVLSGAGFRFSLRGSSGGKLNRGSKTRGFSRVAWTTQFTIFAMWLFVFWSIIGHAVPAPKTEVDPGKGYHADHDGFDSTAASMGSNYPEYWSSLRKPSGDETASAYLWSRDRLARACLERIGVIGISLMALLSGFASVSSPWQTFGESGSRRRRPITEADVSRKQAGLDAAGELLLTKQHRLRSLQRKMDAADMQLNGNGTGGVGNHGGGGGMMGKMFSSIKSLSGVGSADATEVKALQLEISGLETMHSNLSSSLSLLRNRLLAQQRAGTAVGKLTNIPAYLFSIYCVYRIIATTLTSLQRLMSSLTNPLSTTTTSSFSSASASSSFSSTDPINRFLGLLAKHWDPALDQLAWARQISFLLSGVILLASFNSVLTTFHLFARLIPGILQQAQANLALLMCQISATYVISAALLLRGNLPGESGKVVGDALESALEPGFVDRWFEGWFLCSVGLTAVGIWVGRKIAGGGGGDGRGGAGGGGRDYWWDDWDEFGGEEMGQKRS